MAKKSKSHGKKSKADKNSPKKVSKIVRKISSKKPARKTKKKNVSQPSKKAVQKRKRQTGTVQVKKLRGENQIDFTFKNVRSISKKKQLIKDYSGKAIKNQLKGKPPRGVVIVVEGTKRIVSDGKVKRPKATMGKVAPVDFVVNEPNIKGFIEGIVDKLETDYEEWEDMYSEDPENFDGDESAEYGAFEPDSITGVSIKFF